MRIVHLSDLHLGYRQYHRQTPGGINQREADVASVFRDVTGKIIELAPDIVLFAGDIFHAVRPPNAAIVQAFQQFSRLTSALPHAIIVVVAGNHDTPRSAETGSILRLFRALGLHVVDAEPKRLDFPDRGLSILAVPDVPGVEITFDTDPAAAYNVLVMHGELPGVFGVDMGYSEPAAVQVAPEDLHIDRWSYVALGHHHVFGQLAPHACYSGSIEYTSVNLWGDLRRQKELKLPDKCFVEYDLVTKKRTIHKITPARALIDLPPINAVGKTAADVDAEVRMHVERIKGGIDHKIVRQIVQNIPRHIARELDHKALREYRLKALHFHLDTRKPELMRSLSIGGTPDRRPSLRELVRDYLYSRPLPPDADREALVALGLKYLSEAEDRETSAMVIESDGGSE